MHSPPHFIVCTGGTKGDLYPFLRLACGLAAKGLRVTVLAPEVHGEQVRAAGLAYEPNLSEARYHEVLDNPLLFDPHQGLKALFSGTDQELLDARAQLLRVAAGQPAVLLCHPFYLFAGGLAKAAQSSLRVVGAYLAPSNLRTLHDLHYLGPMPIADWLPLAARRLLWQQADARYVDPVTLPGLNRVRAQLGLPAVEHGFLLHMQAQADLSVALFPSWFGPTQADWPQPMLEGGFMLHDGEAHQALPPEVEAFLLAGAPPLVMTLGTGHKHAAAVYHAGVSVAQRTQRRLICLTAFRQQLPDDLPPGVLWAGYAPLNLLLRRCAALLHHGGIGTVAEGLRAAVPQLVLPFAWDQFDNAFRVQALGVGLSLPAKKANATRLSRELLRLMQDAERITQCHRVAALLAHDPDADTLVDRLLHWSITP
ncbi:MAG: hypothetical protein C4K60_08170 [Ideonella sp. MAG2]|nr:MAG: hypothetical protein C4K60_08170 [Ideonella sp. MAG2]